jgi:hypothetical protein
VDPDAINRFPVPLRGAGRASTAASVAARSPAPAPAPAAAPRPRLSVARLVRLLGPLAAFALPLALCAALVLWHNHIRFGSPFNAGYSDEGFTTPFFVGLYGFLFSSGKSIFLFSPLTVLSLPAFVFFWRRWPAEAALAGGLALATLLYYSAWWAWYGGWSWGPRFLVPTLPFLILPLGALLLVRDWARWAVVPLAVAGVGVQLLGVLIDFNAYIVEIVANDPANEAKYLFYPWLSPLIGHLRYLVKGQHLLVAAFDLTRLGFAPWVARVYPPLAIGTLLLAATMLTLLFRPRARRLTGARP